MIEDDALSKPVTMTAKTIRQSMKRLKKLLEKPIQDMTRNKDWFIAHWGNKMGNHYWKIYNNLNKTKCEKKQKEIK